MESLKKSKDIDASNQKISRTEKLIPSSLEQQKLK